MLRKRDDRVVEDVLNELSWDTRACGHGISVAAAEGLVTLRGIVPCYARKVAAQEAAHRVRGVLDVANEIEVKPERTYDDSEIARAVRAALEWDVLVPDQDIHTTVAEGRVALEGEVSNLREREDAERAARQIRGVVGVVNKLTVRHPSADPLVLRAQIEEALERRADREAGRFRVEVNDGRVDVWGRVHSWQERRAVVGSINHAPGVREVKDHLRIDPYF
jgi:osmotically-inducible protein OsmY